jgi:hypothetical protein
VGELVSCLGTQRQLGLVKRTGVGTTEDLAVGQSDVDAVGSRLFVCTWAVRD